MLAALVIVLVALIKPPVKTLPPVMLAVADTAPPVVKFPPVTLPLALIKPVTSKPESVNNATLLAPATVIPMLPLTAPAMFEVPAVIGKPAEVAVTPVSCEPLPIKNEPVLAVMLPTALICPPVNKLPPVMLPVTELSPELSTLPPYMLPVAVITAPINVEPCTVPVALTKPPVVKLPPVTLPVAVIKPPVVKLPPVTLPLTLNKPVMYSPVVANTATFDVPPTLTATLALAA